MKLKPILLLLLVAVALFAVLGRQRPAGMAPSASYGEAAIGGDFTLTGSTGQRISSSEFKGRIALIYMGYSHCPDICPATLSMMGDTLSKLGDAQKDVAFVFITLDPAHDSPQALSEYMKAFDPRITALTGTQDEIKQVMQLYKAYAEPEKNPAPGKMLISHSGLLYLMDRDGKYLRHFESGVKAETLLDALKAAF